MRVRLFTTRDPALSIMLRHRKRVIFASEPTRTEKSCRRSGDAQRGVRATTPCSMRSSSESIPVAEENYEPHPPKTRYCLQCAHYYYVGGPLAASADPAASSLPT